MRSEHVSGPLQGRACSSSPACFLCRSGSLLQVSTFYSPPSFTTQVMWQFYNMMCLQLGTTEMGRVYILTETETSSGLALSLKTRMYFITLALSLCIVIWWNVATPIPKRTLRSQSAGLPVVPKIHKNKMGERAFSYQAALLLNQLQTWVWEADTASAYKNKLRTFLLGKMFS